MNTSNLKPGDRVEVEVKGRKFTATYESFDSACSIPRPHVIEPDDPNVSYRHVSSRQIVKRLEAAS